MRRAGYRALPVIVGERILHIKAGKDLVATTHDGRWYRWDVGREKWVGPFKAVKP